MNKLATLPKQREDFEFGDIRDYVLSLGRKQKNELVAWSTRKGSLDNDLLEKHVLSQSVFDADTNELMGPSVDDWDSVEGYVTGPLIEAVMRLSGFDDDEYQQYRKNSEPTAS